MEVTSENGACSAGSFAEMNTHLQSLAGDVLVALFLGVQHFPKMTWSLYVDGFHHLVL